MRLYSPKANIIIVYLVTLGNNNSYIALFKPASRNSAPYKYLNYYTLAL